MDPAVAQIIISIITVCVPAGVTLASNKSIKRQANRNSARSSILTMILDDKVRMLANEIPENYHAIHDEFDFYRKNYGNSWLHQKVDEYDKAVEEYEKNLKQLTNKK